MGQWTQNSPCGTYDGTFIPGCMGAAAMGRYACTCPKRGRTTQRDNLRSRVVKLEQRIARLEKLVLTPTKEG